MTLFLNLLSLEWACVLHVNFLLTASVICLPLPPTACIQATGGTCLDSYDQDAPCPASSLSCQRNLPNILLLDRLQWLSIAGQPPHCDLQQPSCAGPCSPLQRHLQPLQCHTTLCAGFSHVSWHIPFPSTYNTSVQPKPGFLRVRCPSVSTCTFPPSPLQLVSCSVLVTCWLLSVPSV